MKASCYASAVALLISLTSSGVLYSEEERWFRSEGKHFEVYQKAEDLNLAGSVLEQAEEDLNRILEHLAYRVPEQMWQGNRRIRIFVFPDEQAFRNSRHAPAWASGDASYETRTIATYRESESFFASTLPHEIAHMVLYELTAEHGNVPRWLHEGFALAQENEKRIELDRSIKEAASQGKLLPLTMLTIVDPKEQSSGGATTYYAEAQAFVHYLIERYGPSRFQAFILNLANGKSFEEAILRAYRGKVDDLSELERAFFAALA